MEEVETQGIDHNKLKIQSFPDCFFSEDVISPTMKTSINDPSTTFLTIGFSIVLFIMEGILLVGFFDPSIDVGLIEIGGGLVFGLFLIIGSWNIYDDLSKYYRTYHQWYDKEYFRLLSERGRWLVKLQEDLTDNEAQVRLDIAFQLIWELEEAGRTPLPSVRRLIVPAIGVGSFLIQLFF